MNDNIRSPVAQKQALSVPTDADAVHDELIALANDDVDVFGGRVFSLAYVPDPVTQSLSNDAYRMFAHTNGLNADAFPSLRRMQADVVSQILGWTHAPAGAAGFMTSGGTESLILAVRSALKMYQSSQSAGDTSPGRSPGRLNMVLPTSAHAAFEKAAEYFDVEARRIPVLPDWRANVSMMAEAIDADTVLLVGSAPQYPQGVIDPITELSELATSRNIPLHVDACMGGVTLTFLERAGEAIPLWDFRLNGVTSLSVDLHKYGYTAKGAGVLLYRDKQRRAAQTFVTDNWLGGLYGSSGILGTKSGGPIASAWAVMRHLGDSGYQALTVTARDAALRLANHLEQHDVLQLRSWPDSTLVSFGTRSNDESIFAIADVLRTKGWYLDRQGPPPSLHATINAVHESVMTEFLRDLDDASSRVSASGTTGRTSTYGTIE
ncbi:MAG: aspartate aminotransferase family protein [Actinobacteria bacterium]|nr:aspartate aminotransferase family protein [Actinomycetota bacterium]